MKDWKQELREMFPHGIYELPEFVDRVTGVSPRGDEYVGMAINKEDIEDFISEVEQDLLTQLITECEVMKANNRPFYLSYTVKQQKIYTDGYSQAIQDVLTLLKNKRDNI